MKLAKPETKITYIAMLIDDSVSMSGARHQTLSGFNEQIEFIKKNMVSPEHTIYLTTAIFSEPGKFRILRKWVDPMTVEPLSLSEYTTGGSSTALWDAMNELIEITEEKKEIINSGKNAALIQFFTDGQNNSSQKIKDPSTIRSRVQELSKSDHWTFTYMGIGGIDDIARDYGFNAKNITQFQFGAKGAAANSVTNTAALMSYSSARTAGATYSADLYKPDNKVTKP